MEEIELLRSQVTPPKLWLMAGGGLAWVLTPPWVWILAKLSDALAGWTMTATPLRLLHTCMSHGYNALQVILVILDYSESKAVLCICFTTLANSSQCGLSSGTGPREEPA